MKTIDHTDIPSVIKARIMQWLGDQPGDPPSIGTEALAERIHAAVGATNAALWSLRRHGLVSFRERKGSTEGHGSGLSYADRVRLTEAGRTSWQDGGREALLRTEHVRETYESAPREVSQVAVEMAVEKMEARETAESAVPPPPKGSYRGDMLAWWLKHQPDRRGHIRAYNAWAGLKPTAVQVYQLVERSPEAFALVEGHPSMVEFIGPEDWAFRPKTTAGIRHPVLVAPTTPEVEVVQLQELGPQLQELLSRAGKRAKVEQAITLLEAAGLDADALALLERIPDDSPLEVEILALLSTLGYAPMQ
jgi:hypothetical protein